MGLEKFGEVSRFLDVPLRPSSAHVRGPQAPPAAGWYVGFLDRFGQSTINPAIEQTCTPNHDNIVNIETQNGAHIV